MAEVFVFVAWSFVHCSLAPRNAVVSVIEATVVCEYVNIIIIYTFICSLLCSGM
jgi:multisubunit Na+/H+ antiporter MnhE subunit